MFPLYLFSQLLRDKNNRNDDKITVCDVNHNSVSPLYIYIYIILYSLLAEWVHNQDHEDRTLFSSMVPAHFANLLYAGRGIGTETCAMDSVFPSEDLSFVVLVQHIESVISAPFRCGLASWYRSHVIATLYTILVYSHAHTKLWTVTWKCSTLYIFIYIYIHIYIYIMWTKSIYNVNQIWWRYGIIQFILCKFILIWCQCFAD